MNHIKELRTKKNMNRKQLSDLSGVPSRTIDDWENNRRVPRDVYQLKKVADALQVTIEDLIDWKEPLN
jgi:transcriptional regulator with XRE-family HTH domain